MYSFKGAIVISTVYKGIFISPFFFPYLSLFLLSSFSPSSFVCLSDRMSACLSFPQSVCRLSLCFCNLFSFLFVSFLPSFSVFLFFSLSFTFCSAPTSSSFYLNMNMSLLSRFDSINIQFEVLLKSALAKENLSFTAHLILFTEFVLTIESQHFFYLFGSKCCYRTLNLDEQ